MAQIPSRKCDSCKGETLDTASVYCEECNKSLCNGCKDFHDRFCKDHNVFDINKAGNRVFKAKPVCEFHKKKFFFFCSTCKCLTCDECMTSSHNGHTTDTIKNIVDVYRVNAKDTHDKLKAKVDILHETLEAIKTDQTHQITSDFDSYVLKVEKTCKELYGIVDQTKKIHMTAASDFQTIETQDLDKKRVFFQRQYDESSASLLQIDNLLQESHDVTFFTDWKRLKTDVQNMIEIDQTLQNPRRIESFNEDDFMKVVMEEIDKRLEKSLIQEKETEIEILTNAVKKKETIASELQKENNDLNKRLKPKQAEIEKLSCFIKEKETEIEILTNAVKNKETLACELQKENNDLNKILKPKQAEIEKLSRQSFGSSAVGNKLFCAAIDIGTTHSGYAFSFKHHYTKEPTKIDTCVWQGSKLLTLKAPTAVLLNKNQEFVAFGYEAEHMYSELVSDDEHQDYYYFHNFKMLLHERRITRDIKIKDALDKEMEALRVFKYAIEYMKNRLFKCISEKTNCVQENDLYYVLTVPAIWEDSAKQFMKEAATKAGIKSGQLSIILEPEAASIYCQHLKNTFAQTVKAGMKYMVVDLGGGSADITVHQRNKDGSVREVIPPSGGPWGGKSIDEAFNNFIKRICGPKVMEELRKTELDDLIDLFEEFELKKRSIRVDQTNKVVIKLPVSLIDLVKSHRGKMETALEQSSYGDTVIYSKQKIHIMPDTFRDLFKPSIKALVEHLEAILRQTELRDLKTIVMVGGFSECELVQHKVMERFGRNITIIIPEGAGLAVLKGAVLYGHST